MKKRSFGLLFALILLILAVGQLSVLAETDRDALISLFQATGGPDWGNKSGWQDDPVLEDGFNDDPCAEPLWFGVTCEEGRVTSLSLSQNGLAGMLPAGITNLSELRLLSLPYNHLNGPLPDLSGLSKLETLELSFNELNGPLPDHGLPALQFLDLRSNPLGGTIPAGLGDLSQLTYLELSYSELGGPIPPELGGLALLSNLRLAGNHLVGNIPGALGDLSQLRTLDLSENHLTGLIPPELGNLSNLRQFEAYSNSLMGEIPPELGNLSELKQLTLSRNRIAGPIPPDLGNLSQLQRLDLTGNRLTGSIPPELGNLNAVSFLFLGSNQLSGPIPPELGDLSSLIQLRLASNALNGPIPAELGNLSNLTVLDLSSNQLSGPIPEELSQLTKLYPSDFGAIGLALAGNRLSGEVPAGIAQLPEATLDIRGNFLESVEQGLTAELDLAQAGEASWEVSQYVVAVYPQLALGGGFEVMLTVSSQSPLPWSGKVDLDGGQWPVDRPWELDGIDMTGVSSFPLDLEPFAVRRMVLSSSGDAVDGWLSIRAEGDSSPEDVSPSFSYQLSGDAGLVDSTGVAPAEFASSYFFPVEQAGGPQAVLTGIAFRSIVSAVYYDLYDADGNYVTGGYAGFDQAVLLGELFPNLPQDFVGTLRVAGSSPFYLTVLRMDVTESNGVQLTSIPARVAH